MAITIADQHRAWLNPLQPEGLVISPLTLETAQLALPGELAALQQEYIALLNDAEEPERILSWPEFARDFLDWPDKYILTGESVPDRFTLFLPEYGEEIKPSFVILEKGEPDKAKPQILGMIFDSTADLNKIDAFDRHWPASPVRKLERLLREVDVPIGLISNLKEIKLVYAPRGENVGILTFPIAPMAQVWGRSMVGALKLLLGVKRLWGDSPDHRLGALLEQSRKAQAAVSTELARQVLGALYELLRGFAGADEIVHGALLGETVRTEGQLVYRGLLTVLMRLVFILYAEDRGLMPGTDVYERAYSVHGLWKKLRDDIQRFPDTMDQRYGAWARLLALFRAIYEGCGHPALALPPRYGHLFNPERFPFLEGGDTIPAVSDGTIIRVLDSLFLLNGEKLSYRSLDVEQIGSVYEAVMGFRFKVVSGLSIAIKPKKSHGAPPIVDISALLAKKPQERIKSFKETTDRDLTGKAAEAVKAAGTVDDMLSALSGLQEIRATPHPVPAGGWVLEPTDERRRSGSHYTPRSLTEPIVRKALEPIWKQLGDHPSPEAIKALKICDPAMGSGAFLVEACRQLAERLVDAWHYHGCLPNIPADEDELLYAKRVVAQRCLYGVDRNPMAVDLAKLSLWLTTLAKDHPFTFLDHNLRHGDSLVGLLRKQIVAFHWDTDAPPELGQRPIEDKMLEAETIRKRILDSDETLSPETKATQLKLAEEALAFVRLAGDLTLEAWFSAEKEPARLRRREENLVAFQWATSYPVKRAEVELRIAAMRQADKPIIPFHWGIEFPEVFEGENPGFDVFVGNPPFMGGKRLSQIQGALYNTWIIQQYTESRKNADLVSHFFRRAFDLLRQKGTFGLIATNTIAQGDTRGSGLCYICIHGGSIYSAIKRLKWPGESAVTVSIVHIIKQERPSIPIVLDLKPVEKITAYLFHQGNNDDPKRLASNLNLSFQGVIILGMGFTFDDTDKKGIANSLALKDLLIAKYPEIEGNIIKPYIGGKDISEKPDHAFHRFVIDYGEMTKEQAQKWPEIWEIIETKVKPERLKNDSEKYPRMVNEYWKYWNARPTLVSKLVNKKMVMVISRITKSGAFTFIPADIVMNEKTIIFPDGEYDMFCILHSRIHEIWARFFSTTLEDRLQYTPTDCFETFPFPQAWKQNSALEAAGKAYYDFRADLMIRNNEGLTKTYNRFHDPDETDADIVRLRELHAAMDGAVLAAYGYDDLDTTCDFYLDYEEDEEEESGRKRKKPWRYRWSDEVRDALLARLLDLNARQAAGQDDLPPPADDETEEGEE
ncbi:MAG: N-6 DNA methylase [Spirochaetes bacterium]|nr:N-6 DNA methylase [Spirochaetota bacterium]